VLPLLLPLHLQSTLPNNRLPLALAFLHPFFWAEQSEHEHRI
jgi:hypothetical protein